MFNKTEKNSKPIKVTVVDKRTTKNPYIDTEKVDEDIQDDVKVKSENSCYNDECFTLGHKCCCGKKHKDYNMFHQGLKDLDNICDMTQKVKPSFVEQVINDSIEDEDDWCEDDLVEVDFEDDEQCDIYEPDEQCDIYEPDEPYVLDAFSSQFKVSGYNKGYESVWKDVQDITFGDRNGERGTFTMVVVPTSTNTFDILKWGSSLGNVEIAISQRSNPNNIVKFYLDDIKIDDINLGKITNYETYNDFSVILNCSYNIFKGFCHEFGR